MDGILDEFRAVVTKLHTVRLLIRRRTTGLLVSGVRCQIVLTTCRDAASHGIIDTSPHEPIHDDFIHPAYSVELAGLRSSGRAADRAGAAEPTARLRHRGHFQRRKGSYIQCQHAQVAPEHLVQLLRSRLGSTSRRIEEDDPWRVEDRVLRREHSYCCGRSAALTIVNQAPTPVSHRASLRLRRPRWRWRSRHSLRPASTDLEERTAKVDQVEAIR